MAGGTAFCPENESSGAFWYILNNVQHVDFELAQRFSLQFDEDGPWNKYPPLKPFTGKLDGES